MGDKPHSGQAGVSRRSFLKAAGVGGAAGLAGCVGGIGGSDTIKIGVILPYSGQFQSLGEQFQKGIDLAVEDDLEGEIDGREIELLQRDSQFDPNTGANIAREYLQSDDVDFIVGTLGSAVAEAIKPIIDQAGSATWVNINAATKTLISEDCSPYHVRVSYNSYQLGHPMGEWVYENRGETVAVGFMDYTFGQQTRNDFISAYEEAGGEVVDQIPTPLDTSDFGPIVQRFADSGADAAYCVYSGSVAANFLQAAQDFGLQDELNLTGFGLVDWVNLGAAAEAMVGAEAVGVYSPYRDIPANNEYFEKYQDRYDEIPFGQDAFGYDGIHLIDQAVSEVGNTDPTEIIPFTRGYELEGSPRGTVRINPTTQDVISDVPLLRSTGTNPEDLEVIEVFEAVESPNFGCDLSGTLQ